MIYWDDSSDSSTQSFQTRKLANWLGADRCALHDPKLSGGSTDQQPPAVFLVLRASFTHIYYIIHMDAGLAEAAAFGMGFKGAGSCKCRTAYEIIVPNEEKAACFVQFHQFLVICHMSPRSFKDGGRKNGTSKFPTHSALAPWQRNTCGWCHRFGPVAASEHWLNLLQTVVPVHPPTGTKKA